MKFKEIWADNGDSISVSYTGTGATTSMVTRTGQKNINSIIDHQVKTISRFYYNIFTDKNKHQVIQTILQD